MDANDFVAAFISTVGERCADGECSEWGDHFCDDGELRCLTHCFCGVE